MTLERETLDRLYRYCYSLTGNEDDAYSLLQDGVERYLKANQKQHIEAAVPYIRKIIRNIFIDRARRASRFPEVGLDEVAEGVLELGVSSLEGQVIAVMDMQPLWERLEPMEREVLYLWSVEGHTAQEIATQSEVPRNTILSRIHRIKKKVVAWHQARAVRGGPK